MLLHTNLDQIPLRPLYESLGERRRPEGVAENIREVLGDALDASEARILEQAARTSLGRRAPTPLGRLNHFTVRSSTSL